MKVDDYPIEVARVSQLAQNEDRVGVKRVLLDAMIGLTIEWSHALRAIGHDEEANTLLSILYQQGVVVNGWTWETRK